MSTDDIRELEVLAEIEGRSDITRVRLVEIRRREYIDVRKFYRSSDGTWKPTAKGIVLSPDQVAGAIKGLTSGLLQMGVKYP